MKLTEVERLILWNQYEIRKHLDPNAKQHCEVAQEVLQSGYQPLYGRVLDHMERNELPQHKADFVYEVLNMYDALQRFEQANGKELDEHFAKFRGFDGHGDLIGFARFNVEELTRWDYLNIKEFDAHMPIEGVYQRMFDVWMQKPLPDRYKLTQGDVDAIFAAVTHPDARG